jgi:hypothetical protein
MTEHRFTEDDTQWTRDEVIALAELNSGQGRRFTNPRDAIAWLQDTPRSTGGEAGATSDLSVTQSE